jgi:DNA-binding NtrC family response regulator
LRLPDGSGIDLIQGLRGLNPMPIVIVMTAYAMSGNAIKTFKEGAVGYLTKPLDIDKLKRALRVYLENRSGMTGGDKYDKGGQ